MSKKISYKDAGVNITQAEKFVDGIKGMVKATARKGVVTNPKAFGSLFALDTKKYKNPLMVSSTDGVGTKLLLAQAAKKHNTVGIDLVAMNVNDILCTGAEPLFFLDYIACGKLNPRTLKSVMQGIAKGCEQSGCALIGGETAEMPGMYKQEEYDLAGFCVGAVDQKNLIDGTKIKAGDVVIGLPSSGLHSNGYSLARKLFSKAEQTKHIKKLLEPTRIYTQDVLPLIGKQEIHGMAHVTGGGFYEKMTKVLPKGLCFQIEQGSWKKPAIFDVIEKKDKVAFKELYRTFNMGIGFVLVVPPKAVNPILKDFHKRAVTSFVIGEVIKDSKHKVLFT